MERVKPPTRSTPFKSPKDLDDDITRISACLLQTILDCFKAGMSPDATAEAVKAFLWGLINDGRRQGLWAASYLVEDGSDIDKAIGALIDRLDSEAKERGFEVEEEKAS